MKVTYTDIVRVALPLVLGQLAWTVVGVVDTAYLGHYSSVALAAGGYSGMYFLLVMMLCYGYTRGSQIRMAQSLGEGNPHEVGVYFTNTLFVCTVAGVVIAGLMYLTADLFFTFVLHDKATIQGCVEFISWRVIGLPAAFVSSAYIAFYSGIGRTMLLMYSILVMSVFNLGLNPILIFGMYGMPELGIKGSALSSVVSEWLSLLILIGGSMQGHFKKVFRLYDVSCIQLSFLRNLWTTSMPLILQQLLGLGGWFIFFAFIEKMSARDLAASNIIRQVFSVIGVVVFTLGSATNTLVGQLYGQRALAGIVPAVHKLVRVSVLITSFLCIAAYVFSAPLITLFSPDSDLQRLTASVLPVILIGLIIMSVSSILLNALISLGDTLPALIIEVLSMSIYFVYFLGIYFIPGRSLYWMWTAEWVYWIFILIFVIYSFRQKKI